MFVFLCTDAARPRDTHRYHGVMVICSICAHSDWCDGGDTCDCQCHDNFDESKDDEDEDDDEEIYYEED
jgi:hypothetical protein